MNASPKAIVDALDGLDALDALSTEEKVRAAKRIIEARPDALEEAAKECDGVAFFYADPADGQDRDIVRGAKYSAQRIRALSAKDAGPKGEGSK